MVINKAPGLLAAMLASGLILGTYTEPSAAQSAQDQAMQDRIDDLAKQLDAMKKEQQAQAAKAPAAPAAPATGAGATAPSTAKAGAKPAAPEDKFDKFLKGFYGTLDSSLDFTTKGIDQQSAYHWSYTNPLNPGSGLVRGANKGFGAVGRVGYILAMSSDGSNVGYRGSHRIPKTDTDFIYQVSTSLDIAAAPGLNNTWTKSSNVVTGALGLGDTYIGFKSKRWGTLKFGEQYAPYKTSTDRLNPFNGQLGGYNTIMGNTGGDNRVEFGTRFDHAIVYNSPVIQGFSVDLMFAPGQNVTFNNVTTPLGSPDCAGGNSPGSGNLFNNCDDGGFGDAWSADLKFEKGGLYLTAAWELHRSVNRNSDGIGSNSPYYNYLVATNIRFRRIPGVKPGILRSGTCPLKG